MQCTSRVAHSGHDGGRILRASSAVPEAGAPPSRHAYGVAASGAARKRDANAVLTALRESDLRLNGWQAAGELPEPDAMASRKLEIVSADGMFGDAADRPSLRTGSGFRRFGFPLRFPLAPLTFPP